MKYWTRVRISGKRGSVGFKSNDIKHLWRMAYRCARLQKLANPTAIVSFRVYDDTAEDIEQYTRFFV